MRRFVAKRYCQHQVPESLQAHLSEPTICPSCQLQRFIKDIRDTQKGIDRRGGIFASRERVREEANVGFDGEIGTQAKRHRAWMRLWRQTKIKVVELVSQLEDIIKTWTHDEEVLGIEMVKEGLKLWREVEEEMAIVPGSVQPNSEYADVITTCITEGTIVPQEIAITLIKNAMKHAMDQNSVTMFLINGKKTGRMGQVPGVVKSRVEAATIGSSGSHRLGLLELGCEVIRGSTFQTIPKDLDPFVNATYNPVIPKTHLSHPKRAALKSQ
ncbi:hypothetical protein K504DRAFT_492762 [Pleomassaria siparia CBS 279.74]|uniref:Uncharacterized protein n=1 Tax=Pleomassaria siparia CBS 279.74 TaxID=1314801 RepID=A0A6G1K3C9_9PLEO|nr:hypothetical protein K504DRAFT_492762 [Pleomassaria siparia CBS 279.74]